MKPPSDVAPSELFSKLLEMPRPNEVIDFPRNDAQGQPVGRVRIQVLTSVEHDDARKRAHDRLKKSGVGNEDMSAPALKEVLGDMIAKELIAIACVSERDFAEPGGKPVHSRMFRDAVDVGQLGADEILVLFNAYQLVQSKYGPFERNLSDDDIDAWILRLGEGGSAFPLLNLVLPQLVQLAQSLAQRVYALCRILESQRETLPTSLESELQSFFLGIGSAGKPAGETDPSGSDRRDRPLTPITAEVATEIARRMRNE